MRTEYPISIENIEKSIELWKEYAKLPNDIKTEEAWDKVYTAINDISKGSWYNLAPILTSLYQVMNWVDTLTVENVIAIISVSKINTYLEEE